MTKEKSIRKLCKDANIARRTFYNYRKKYPELADTEIIELAIYNIKGASNNSYKELAKQAGVSKATLYKYKKLYSNLTKDELLNKLKTKKVISDAKKLSYQDLIESNDLATIAYKLKKSDATLKKKCLATGVSYKQAVDYRRYYKANHGKILSDDDIIIHYLTRRQPFKAKCREYGINPQTATNYKTRNPHLTDEEIIKHFLDKKDKEETVTFADKCRQANISYKAALFHRKNHPELTDEQVILHYNPYCYFNIQGDFIIVPLPEIKGDK